VLDIRTEIREHAAAPCALSWHLDCLLSVTVVRQEVVAEIPKQLLHSIDSAQHGTLIHVPFPEDRTDLCG
jgi:hypothetical protein